MTLFFDEFGLARATYTHYAWSRRNHRPGIPSDETHKGDRLNGLLAVDVRSGETFLEFYERNHSMTVAEYFVILCLLLIGRGYKKIRLVLDNCASHQEQMRTHFNKLLKYILQDLFSIVEPTIQFIYTPPYSPDLNLAEYFIHHLRQHGLYHTPPTLTVQQKADRIATKLKEKPIQTPQQTHNTLQHIYQLVRL